MGQNEVEEIKLVIKNEIGNWGMLIMAMLVLIIALPLFSQPKIGKDQGAYSKESANNPLPFSEPKCLDRAAQSIEDSQRTRTQNLSSMLIP